MMIKLNIEKRKASMSTQSQNLANAVHAREALREEFEKSISKSKYSSKPQKKISETTLKLMTMKYSEQSVFYPIKEIRSWFAYSKGLYLTPGYPPLFYSRTSYKKISPNKSAVGSIGEGVAGLLSQQIFNCKKLARPNHDYPDIVMETTNGPNRKTYLVESKATLGNDIKEDLNEELPRMATLASSCKKMDNRPVRGLLIGTNIKAENEYNCYITEVIPK